MSFMIKEIPIAERPRERFKKYGVGSLSNEELLSILIRTGTPNRSVKDVSLNLLQEIDIQDLVTTNYKTLKKIKGIGEVKAITILSAIELGKRALKRKETVGHISRGDDVYYLVKEELENELQENFMVIYLDTKYNILFKKVLFVGTVNKSKVTARDVFREAVKNNATYMILAHNHPAGTIKPSIEDINLTKELIKLGKMMDIEVIDHVIIGNNRYYSLRESNGDLFATKK